MAWIEPKTDWTIKDYFNAEDYNRMIGNLAILKEMADELFIGIYFSDMGQEKSTDGLAYIYAREFNAIEQNLLVLTNIYQLGSTARIYRDNGVVPDAAEYNRIESAMLELYNKMINHKSNLTRLAFTLGGQKGIRV